MATLQTLPEPTALVAGRAGNGATLGSLGARSFLYAVFKHRRLVVGVFLVVFLGSAVAALMRPRTWLASSRVLVKLGETVQLAPAEAPSRSINLPLNQEVVKTEADIVRSREVIEDAVARLGIQPEPGTDHNEFITGLQRGLTVTPSPGTNTIQISFIGKHPEKVARLVNAITAAYIDHHNAVYRRDGLHSFYVEQLRVLESEMKTAQRRLRDYLKKTDVVDVDAEIRLLTADAIDQDKNLRAQRAKIHATERKLAEVRDQLANTPQQVAFSEEYQANPMVTAYKTKLADLESQRIDVLQRYMPDDRRVRDIESEIALLRAQMSREQGSVLGKQTLRRNDLYGELQRTLFSLESLLADARAREPSLKRRLAATNKRLRRLRDRRFLIANLEQDAQQKQYAYDLYFKKHEEARISEAMTDQSMVNVSVVDKASPPLEPLNGVVLPLLLGLVGGLGLATAMAVAVEYLNRRLRFEEEVERYLELPVLAVIPDLETTPDLARG